MILLSSPLKTDPLETTVSIFFLEIEIVTTKIVNSKSLKKICRQLPPTMNVLDGRLFSIAFIKLVCVQSANEYSIYHFCIMIKDLSISFSRVIIVLDFKTVYLPQYPSGHFLIIVESVARVSQHVLFMHGLLVKQV